MAVKVTVMRLDVRTSNGGSQKCPGGVAEGPPLGNKDCWVLGERRQDTRALWPPGHRSMQAAATDKSLGLAVPPQFLG